ncbi:MAG: hypothetical protein KF689_01175 [Gemmatimonadaceae bacterium]|nr:hypothetical protein [Gemmatimonadaceae bacterium]MCW5826542.1 hypothetical protein [Gemmatimonadaceae bacterium]
MLAATPGAASGQVATIGAEGDIYAKPIGSVGPALILEQGRLVVADASEHTILLVTPIRRSVRSFGRRGQGPGEFMHISAFFRLGPQRFGVVDASVRRVSVLRIVGDSLELESTASTDAVGREMCSIGPRHFLHGNPVQTPLVEVEFDSNTKSLSPVGRFGQRLLPFAGDPDHPMIHEFNAIGAMGCDPASRAIAWAPAQRGALQVVGIDNGLVQTILLPDFSGVVYTAIQNGIRNSVPAAGYLELTERVFIARGGWLLIGQTRAGRTGAAGWWARLVSTENSSAGQVRRAAGFAFAPIAQQFGWTACLSSPEEDITIVFGPSSEVPCSVERMFERR